MASDYRAADGSDVVLGSLTVLSPQPSADLVMATRRTFAGDGTVYDEGLYVVWRWSIISSVTEYQAILTVLGVQSALTNAVTIYTRNEQGTYTRYNGTAIRPQPAVDITQRDYLLRNLQILIRDLSLSA